MANITVGQLFEEIGRLHMELEVTKTELQTALNEHEVHMAMHDVPEADVPLVGEVLETSE